MFSFLIFLILIKGQKDSYGWEIKVFGKEMGKVLEELRLVNDQLKKDYGAGGEDEK